MSRLLISARMAFVLVLLAYFPSYAQAAGNPGEKVSPVQPVPQQVAAVQTRRTIEAVEREEVPTQPYQQVAVSVNSPSTSIANKPFIVIYRFASPVSGFTRELIEVTQGRLTYFAGNQARTVYRILVVSDTDLHLSDDPFTVVTFNSPVSGDLTRKVRIVEPPKQDENTGNMVDLEPHLLGHVLLSRGGDNVTGSDVQIGNTIGFQLGFTYPLPSFSTVLDEIIPRGSVRVHVGYEELTAGSRSGGDYNKFSAINADLLYEILFSAKYKLIGGVTMAFDPKLESQNLELRDYRDERDADVEFDNAYGVKLLLEYTPFGISADVDFFINVGFTIIDYLPKKIVLNDSRDYDSADAGRNVLSSPTRVGGSSFKLALGIRY